MAEQDPLPDDIQALLSRARDGAPAPPGGVEDVVLARLDATLAASAGAGAATTIAWLKPVLGVAALALSGVVGVVLLRAPASDPPSAAITPAPSASSHVPSTNLREAAAPLTPAIEQAVEPTPPSRASGAAPGEPPTESIDTDEPPRAPSDGAAEGVLLEAARGALARGDADLALRKLEEHQKRFGPKARLTEERHALTVVALAQRGDGARARSAAKAFFRLYPHSLFGDTVRAATPDE